MWWIFLLALAVRGIFLALTHHDNVVAGMAQGELARNLVLGRGFVVNTKFAEEIARAQVERNRLIDIQEWIEQHPPEDRPEDFHPFIAYAMPGQGILLAGTYFIFGSYRYIYLQIVQVLADSLGVLLIFWIGVTLFSRRIALLAALLYAVYLPEARFAVAASHNSWMGVWYLASAAGFIIGWKKERTLYMVLAGCAVGAGAYFRSEILMLPLFFGVALFVAGTTFVKSSRVLAAYIPVLLLLAPWTIRNYDVFHRVIPTNTGLFMALWQSFGEYENDFGAVNDDAVTLQQMRAQGHTEEYDSPEYDDLFREKVFRVVQQRPGWFIWTALRRVASVPLQMHRWGIRYTDDEHGFERFKQARREGIVWKYITDDPVRFVVQSGAVGTNLLLYAAVLVWCWLFGRQYWRPGLLILAAPAYNILLHALLGMQARYILPTNSFLLVFAGMVGLVVLQLWKRSSGQEIPSAG